jgi:phosphomannomutase
MDLSALRPLAERWIADDPDPVTQAELRELLAQSQSSTGGPSPGPAAAQLADRFAASLEFGTAGLRGVLGAGPNRMNRAVVARATWGLAQELLASVPGAAERGVVVGGDARRLSRELSEDTAAILAAAGLRVLLCEEPVPTPFVAFAIQHLHAAGGVIVTASHNPPQYNGYKAYWENAAQIIPPVDARIAAAIDRAPPARSVVRPPIEELRARGAVTAMPAEVTRAYLSAVHDLQVHAAAAPEARRALRVVYTPMHGVGDFYVRSALSQAGFADVTSVPQQQKPDGAFPTVSFPNPEEPGAMDLALALAREKRADLVLANDPDADRLAVAVPAAADGAAGAAGAGFRQLTGNEFGVLLGHYLLTEKPARGPRVVIASIVSTPLLGRIAASLGVGYEETLTGFKWIANRAMELEAQGTAFVFGFEEALGYTVGDVVRDKDGISAALLAAEMAAVLRERGRTFHDELDAIARRWGAFTSTQVNLTRTGASGAAAIAAMMGRLRSAPPRSVAGDDVVSVADYQARARTDLRTGATSPLTLPASNVLTFDLASGSRIIARPSGTEPKAKFYFDVREEVAPNEPVSEAMRRARERAQHLSAAFAAAHSSE